MTVGTEITPEHTWALVVAVESYPLRPALDLGGPFPDACDFARWLCGPRRATRSYHSARLPTRKEQR